MSQITFPVILLFSFRELKGRVAFCTRDFQVWHGGFSNRVSEAGPPFLPSERWRRFSPTVCVPKRFVSQTLRRQLTRPIRLMVRVYSSVCGYTNFLRGSSIRFTSSVTPLGRCCHIVVRRLGWAVYPPLNAQVSSMLNGGKT